MRLTINDIWTAVEMGYEDLAMLQLAIAKRSRISGSPSINNEKMLVSLQLYSNVTALEKVPFGRSQNDMKIAEKLYSNIKLITKDIRQWT